MSPEEQRIAIAEACGWDVNPRPLGAVLCYYKVGNDRDFHASLPNYLNDLNAMHEAEKLLFTRNDWSGSRFETILQDMTTSWPWHASAAQRAEAFLKTIGKWKGAQ